MNYLNISFTHKNTDISTREKLSFGNDEKKEEALKLVCSNVSISECVLLSTCNRVEVIAFVNDLEVAKNYILKAISILSGVALIELEDRADIYYGSGAIHHLFSVASSLDSLVVGETQIVGQLKNAFLFSLDRNYCDINIKRAVEASFKCAAQVRNKTLISKNPVSVASVAVVKAKEIFGNLDGMNAVVIGAGDMGELACRHLVASGASLVIVNRSKERAQNVMRCLNGNVKYEPYKNLEKCINSHQIIFSATSSPDTVIDDSLIAEQNFDRYFFDIAVPRDIDITESDKIKVYSVDDLQEIVKVNLAMREEQAQAAYSIVGKSTNDFLKWLKTLATTPIIKALRLKAKETAEFEIEKAIKKGYLKNSDKEEARRLIHQVFKSFLHTPTINLKNIGDDEDADSIVSSIQDIFDIRDEFEEYSMGIEKLEMIDEI
ncbi:glutamyl-tRNA reductase [Campylobacter blaseri]|uniref:Glutamyl-tRNA reductase n=1 Tax=Campylobacter blaseri TaxID=2042961 RepID=A0A2P8QZK3_9BACT|nr:glutamyl-tRNA reductase [Campylobacter blaseri]PSM51670.1 glutamyl-tRNA reductase [Campylobacter blaseri]PSM53460.1 glutamyl-tRNA reductase [Campylobacter blaseri]QKF86265.1 glutamyl-tRNA reductase [Campylobacter blaseri]